MLSVAVANLESQHRELRIFFRVAITVNQTIARLCRAIRISAYLGEELLVLILWHVAEGGARIENEIINRQLNTIITNTRVADAHLPMDV